MCSHSVRTKTRCIEEKKATEFFLLVSYMFYFIYLFLVKVTHNMHTQQEIFKVIVLVSSPPVDLHLLKISLAF